MPELEEVRQELRDTGPLDNLASTVGALRQHQDRSFIVQAIVWTYIGGVAASIGYAAYRGIFCADGSVSATIFEIVKIAILPVLTLVIGYYFGTRK